MKLIMENIIITFQEPWFKSLEDYKKILELEYNSNTSAGHPIKDDDIQPEDEHPNKTMLKRAFCECQAIHLQSYQGL